MRGYRRLRLWLLPLWPLWPLWKDECAQATTEYILMIAVAVGLAISVIKKVIQPSLEKLQTAVMNRMEKTMFGKDGFHRLNIGGR